MAFDGDTKVQLMAVYGEFDVMAASTAQSRARLLLL